MKSVNLKKIKMLREQKNLTQLKVAQALGYESSLGYHYLEKGRCQIKAHQVPILANLFEVEINELYSDDNVVTMATGTDGR